jgi:hypothetical protein
MNLPSICYLQVQVLIYLSGTNFWPKSDKMLMQSDFDFISLIRLYQQDVLQAYFDDG